MLVLMICALVAIQFAKLVVKVPVNSAKCQMEEIFTSQKISKTTSQRGLVMSLASIGTEIQFTSRAPTSDELSRCPHVNLASKADWNPAKISLSQSSTSPGDWSDDADLLNICPREILLCWQASGV